MLKEIPSTPWSSPPYTHVYIYLGRLGPGWGAVGVGGEDRKGRPLAVVQLGHLAAGTGSLGGGGGGGV